MKNLLRSFALAACIVPALFAADDEAARLRDEVRQLQEQVRLLSQRVEKQEQSTTAIAETTRRIEAQTLRLEDEALTSLAGLAQERAAQTRWTLSGNLDIVAYRMDQRLPSDIDGDGTHDATGDKSSDIMVDQLRLQLDIPVNENVTGRVALQMEDWQSGSGVAANGGDTEFDDDVQLDEAWIKLHNDMLYAIVGKQYFPFGNVQERGHFILDSAVRQLSETRDTGITLGATPAAGLDFAVFAFNARTDQLEKDGDTIYQNDIATYGASASMEVDDEAASWKVGAGYISNLFAANNSRLQGARINPLDASSLSLFGPLLYQREVPAANVYAVGEIGPVWLSAELTTAIQSAFGGDLTKAYRPMSYTLEAAFTFDLAERQYVAAAKYERNRDQEFWNVAEEVYGVGISTELFANTTLSVNWEYWDIDDITYWSGGEAFTTGVDGSANVILTELSIAF